MIAFRAALLLGLIWTTITFTTATVGGFVTGWREVWYNYYIFTGGVFALVGLAIFVCSWALSQLENL